MISFLKFQHKASDTRNREGYVGDVYTYDEHVADDDDEVDEVLG